MSVSTRLEPRRLQLGRVVSDSVDFLNPDINSGVEKGQVVKMAGGVGMLLLNTESDGEELRAEPHVLCWENPG